MTSTELSVTCRCGALLLGRRADSRYCSGACRQKAYRDRERAEIATMAAASDEQFEAALVRARAEGDLSRPNVVRLLSGSRNAEAEISRNGGDGRG